MACIIGVVCYDDEREYNAGDVDVCQDCFDAFTNQLDRVVKAYRRDYRSSELEDEISAAEQLLRDATAAEARS